MLNSIVLIGRTTRDPELRYTAGGTPVANMTIAVDRPFVKQGGTRETDFIDIVVWRTQAENCAKYLGKGRLIACEGRLQIRSYTAQDGTKRKVAEIVADNVKFLDRAKDPNMSMDSVPEVPFSDPKADKHLSDFGAEISFDDDSLPF